LQQKNLRPYRCLINSDQLVRIYLDELPLALFPAWRQSVRVRRGRSCRPALPKAKDLVPRVRSSKRPYTYRQMVIQFIETVIVHQFPHWSREEIEKMLKVNDVRQTRVFQEGREEGIDEGLEKGVVALRLIKLNRPIAEIVEATGLTAAQVRKLKKSQPPV
jgi:predicted transposase YdaD